jgi:choline dehydrogenase-like flavoprotein
MTNTYVDEILFKKGKKLIASGVRYTLNVDLKTTSAHTAKEVILAAGGVCTPHLLMLLGIEPRNQLSAANIRIKKDL